MRQIDFLDIVRQAWYAFDRQRPLSSVSDISAKVSTNHVYRAERSNGDILIAKLSFFGKYEHFEEDHAIINELAQLLSPPYEQVLANSLTRYGKLFTYRHQEKDLDIWVVFYLPVDIQRRVPKKLKEADVPKLGAEIARFHAACDSVVEFLPPSSKGMASDLQDLKNYLNSDQGLFRYHGYASYLVDQCDQLLEALQTPMFEALKAIPVFVDWNIGNFSLTEDWRLYSRWDYDWFRMSSRTMDFYFFSRVVSEGGDQTVFSYVLEPLLADRFVSFLKAYHAVFPLTEGEIRFIKEAYRFFILHYVINFGEHFFHSMYANRLQQEACEKYLPELERSFEVERLLSILSP
ncbi:MAG: hypothetical protein AAF399_27520 [Bacteroidota bacterium]